MARLHLARPTPHLRGSILRRRVRLRGRWRVRPCTGVALPGCTFPRVVEPLRAQFGYFPGTTPSGKPLTNCIMSSMGLQFRYRVFHDPTLAGPFSLDEEQVAFEYEHF